MALSEKVSALCLVISLLTAISVSCAADLQLSPVFTDHMVLQRDKAVAVYGMSTPGENITVTFSGQTLKSVTDKQGHWSVSLAAMPANTKSQTLTVTGAQTITINDVVVGDVWLCSGQSNMDWRMNGCKRQEDIDSAKFPGIRQLTIPLGKSDRPMETFSGKVAWQVCTPQTAAEFSAVGYYFARKIHIDSNSTIPIGIILSSVGGTRIDAWLAPDGIYDIPVLHPLLKKNPLSSSTFIFFNGMIAPISPFTLKGALWYQGENSENEALSPDSYYLKMKALAQGWKRVWGMSDFPFYFVMIANWGKVPTDATPVLISGGWDADTRLQQANAMAIPHSGCASAIDIGDSSMGDRIWDGWHPKDKLDVGERLALWALKNDYGRNQLITSGPVLHDVTIVGNTAVCSFDHVGSGLMIGTKKWYEPTREEKDGKLRHFVIAGTDGKWHPADAVIKDKTVLLSSPAISEPRKISYACWQNPEFCNFYNKEGLPGLPFHIDDITMRFSIAATAGQGGEITPSGTKTFLRRMTALYTITPKSGFYIQDVKVDGVSVGSITAFTFDPLSKNHTIAAEFSPTAPSYTILVSASGGGMISPSGKVTVKQGNVASFSLTPNPGNSVSLTIDGITLGQRDHFTFSDVRTSHTIAASFACTLNATSGFGGSISPCGTVTTEYGGNQSFSIATLPGYQIASVNVDGKSVGTANKYSFAAVTASHTISVKYRKSAPLTGAIPRTSDLLFACRAENLITPGPCSTWAAMFPSGKQITAMQNPEVLLIDDKKYAHFISEKGTGFLVGTYAEPIPCAGASLIVVLRPVRNGFNSGWTSAVDLFFDRLGVGVRGDSGLVCVRRNVKIDDSKSAIPDGQITILSLIVQPNGTYKTFANDVEILSNETVSPMTALGPSGNFNTITLGRNNPDAWTAFNGDIGDVFIYKVALTDNERKGLEAHIADRLISSH